MEENQYDNSLIEECDGTLTPVHIFTIIQILRIIILYIPFKKPNMFTKPSNTLPSPNKQNLTNKFKSQSLPSPTLSLMAHPSPDKLVLSSLKNPFDNREVKCVDTTNKDDYIFLENQIVVIQKGPFKGMIGIGYVTLN